MGRLLTKPRPYQREGVRGIYEFRGRALLADEQGLGKSFQALWWIQRTPRHRPVVILCPSSVKYTWQLEGHTHFDMHIEVLEGKHPRKSMRHPGDIVVVNYDILPYWLPILMKRPPATVIIDEVQYVKNPESQRSKAAAILCGEASSVVGLSGTPFTNKLIELWGGLSLIVPDLFPSRFEYAWRYCDPKHTHWGWKFDGARHKKELRRILLKACMIRRLKKDVAPEIPDKIHKVVPFQLSSSDFKEYRKARDHFLQWLRQQSAARAHRAKKAQALIKVGYLLRLCAELKLKWTVKWIQEWVEANPGKKLVGMTMNTFVIDHLKKEFSNSVVINGNVTGRKRFESVRKFQTNSRVQFLWGNWKAAGVGLTLTASHTLVALDLPWTPGDLLQGQDRVHRIGQKEKVLIYYLLCLGTAEMKLMDVLKERTDTFREIMDGTGKGSDSVDIFDLLIKELKHG